MKHKLLHTLSQSPFKSHYTLPQRKQKAKQIRDNTLFYPIIIESSFLFDNQSNKYLQYALTGDIRTLQLLDYVRKRYSVGDRAISFGVGGRVFGTQQLVGELYEQYAEEDGFLYFRVQLQSFF